MALNFDKNVAEGYEEGVRWATKTAPMYGAVNGYIQLPEGHPWRAHELQLGEGPDIDVHGGITYGPDASGWIGFDTLHAGDVWPGSPSWQIELGGRKWTAEDVAYEARNLARQAAAAEVSDET